MPIQIPEPVIEKAYSKIKALSEYLPPGSCKYATKEPIGYVLPGAIHSYVLTYFRTDAFLKGHIGLIPKDVSEEIVQNVRREKVPFKRAEVWENKIGHDIRAKVRAAQESLSDRAKHYLYQDTTSYDPLSTAYSLGLRDMGLEVLLPKTVNLARIILRKANEEAEINTLRMGRTHLQHANVTTLDHYLASRANGLIDSIPPFIDSIQDLRGKRSGFLGNHSEFRLIHPNYDPRAYNKKFFKLLHLKEDEMTEQNIHQQYHIRYFTNLGLICGEVAKFADDIRLFQQTEVGEISEGMSKKQVGSSTGAHKKNPVSCENISGGQWRQYVSQLGSTFQDIVTNFERDLRDSSNKRYYMPELTNKANYMLDRMTKVVDGMVIDRDRMRKNIGITGGLFIAQPIQICLQKFLGDKGRPFEDAHEHLRDISNKARDGEKDFVNLIKDDPLISEMLNEYPVIVEKIFNPKSYVEGVSENVMKFIKKKESYLDIVEEGCKRHKEFVYV